MEFKLHLNGPDGATEILDLGERAELTLGRGPRMSCQLLDPEQWLSREHLIVANTEDGPVLKVRGTNGITVAGEEYGRGAELFAEHGTIVEMGFWTMELRANIPVDVLQSISEAPPPPPPPRKPAEAKKPRKLSPFRSASKDEDEGPALDLSELTDTDAAPPAPEKPRKKGWFARAWAGEADEEDETLQTPEPGPEPDAEDFEEEDFEEETAEVAAEEVEEEFEDDPADLFDPEDEEDRAGNFEEAFEEDPEEFEEEPEPVAEEETAFETELEPVFDEDPDFDEELEFDEGPEPDEEPDLDDDIEPEPLPEPATPAKPKPLGKGVLLSQLKKDLAQDGRAETPQTPPAEAPAPVPGQIELRKGKPPAAPLVEADPETALPDEPAPAPGASAATGADPEAEGAADREPARKPLPARPKAARSRAELAAEAMAAAEAEAEAAAPEPEPLEDARELPAIRPRGHGFFRADHQLTLGATSTVELTLAPGHPMTEALRDTLTAALTASGVSEDDLPPEGLAMRVSAELTGEPRFANLSEAGPARMLSPDDTGRFSWQIDPKMDGYSLLLLDMTAEASAGGKAFRVAIKPLPHSIEIMSSPKG